MPQSLRKTQREQANPQRLKGDERLPGLAREVTAKVVRFLLMNAF
jgi:hypothetical protein